MAKEVSEEVEGAAAGARRARPRARARTPPPAGRRGRGRGTTTPARGGRGRRHRREAGRQGRAQGPRHATPRRRALRGAPLALPRRRGRGLCLRRAPRWIFFPARARRSVSRRSLPVRPDKGTDAASAVTGKRRRVGFAGIDAGTEANECMQVFLARNPDEVGSADSTPIKPFDLNHFFGENGKIYGYTNLKINVWINICASTKYTTTTSSTKYTLPSDLRQWAEDLGRIQDRNLRMDFFDTQEELSIIIHQQVIKTGGVFHGSNPPPNKDIDIRLAEQRDSRTFMTLAKGAPRGFINVVVHDVHDVT